MLYKRKCPECSVEINYKSKSKFVSAEQNTKKCRKCCTIKLSNEQIDEILRLNLIGLSNRAIGKKLSINHRTVSDNLKKLGKKSSVANQKINFISDTQAICSKCELIKNINEFQFGRKGQKYEYKFSYCNDCRKKQSYLALNENIESFLNDRFTRLKARSKKLNIICSLTKEQFMEQYYNQNGLCFYTDVEMVCKTGCKKNKDSLSIDKIIPELGYVVGNFVFCSNRINSVKYDLSIEEIQKFMPTFYERIQSHLAKYKDKQK